MKQRQEQRVKNVGEIITAIERRSKKRNKNMEAINQMKKNYFTLKMKRNKENEIKHKHKIRMTRRKEMNRKEMLIDKIQKKNNK